MKYAIGGLTGIVMLASAGVASAADLYKPAAVPPPVVPYVLGFSWTGFYVGAQVGYGFGGDDRVGIASDVFGFVGDASSLELAGAFGGIHLGYNWQVGGFVLGLEGEINYSGISDSATSTALAGVLGGFDTVRSSSDVTWYGVIGPRIGFAWDRLLIYGTGGFAFGNVDYKVTGVDGPFSFAIRDDDVQTGWALGAGLEYAFAPNWTARVEYKYLNFGRYALSADVLDGGGNPIGETITTQATPDFHTVKLGITYKFGYEPAPPPPAVVKY